MDAMIQKDAKEEVQCVEKGCDVGRGLLGLELVKLQGDT